ncbi:uncharacterized protein FPRO_14406 [Fusarium proliferatum ET1]|uniref:2EXR domain-containing protein n=1 Tax=Fusarium proliferatum (strain ET1) TaxID=1227346 RepID=A0A1L7VW32_FUSPR|nr:uncharacterized protein FPRO_14406 [Fusarium proliferatum ET1]CZR44653.1 uncharacterized protein FPRO_14406 [Fusarium proliferatum ET1]
MHEHPTSDPEPKVESLSDLSSFRLFSQLPAELQFMIWESAFDATSRFINIHLYMALGYDGGSNLPRPNMCITGGSFILRGRETDKFRESHRLSLACWAARKVYLLRYPQSIILLNSVRRKDGYSRIRCNIAYDILCIEKINGIFHEHDDRRLFTTPVLTQVARQAFSSSRKVLSSFQHVAVRLRRGYPSRDHLATAFATARLHFTVQQATLLLFSFFESIRHLYFPVKSKNPATDDTEFFRGLPAQGYTPAPVQSFLDFYDRVQRYSEQVNDSDCDVNHRKWRPRPLRDIQCYYGREWLEKA